MDNKTLNGYVRKVRDDKKKVLDKKIKTIKRLRKLAIASIILPEPAYGPKGFQWSCPKCNSVLEEKRFAIPNLRKDAKHFSGIKHYDHLSCQKCDYEHCRTWMADGIITPAYAFDSESEEFLKDDGSKDERFKLFITEACEDEIV